MLYIISDLFLKYWSSVNRPLANSLLAILLPLFILIIYQYISNSIHISSIKSLPFRNLRGKTIILFAPSLDSVALELTQELSKRGAQLLIAVPSPVTDPRNLQLILLLRDPGGNESIFLEKYSIDSIQDTLEFAQRWITSAKLPQNTTRLDSLIFLPEYRSSEQSFLLVNLFLPYLITQLQTGPPIRVIQLEPNPIKSSLWRTFQHQLGPNPPLILIPSASSCFDTLWALLVPTNQITPGLYHRHSKPIKNQSPLDQELLDRNLKLVETIIQTSLKNKQKP